MSSFFVLIHQCALPTTVVRSQDEVRRGGFFRPPLVDFATAVGPPYPAKKPTGALQTPYNGETYAQQTWGNYVPQLYELLNVEHFSPPGVGCIEDSRPIVQTGPQGEVLLQTSRHDDALWRSTDGGMSFESWCKLPLSFQQQQQQQEMEQAQGWSIAFTVIDDGTVLATRLENTTRARIYRGRYDKAKHNCSWEGEGLELPSLLPGHCFAPLAGRFTDLGGGHVLYPLTANDGTGDDGGDDSVSYGLLYETLDHGRSWVRRGMMGKYRSEIDLLPLDASTGSLIAASHYQTSGVGGSRTIPLYKQSAVQFSSDFGFTWEAPRLVTGYLQTTPSILKLSDGTLVLTFSHQPPVTQQRAGGIVGYAQRFIVSFDNGTSWSNRIFSLCRGE